MTSLYVVDSATFTGHTCAIPKKKIFTENKHSVYKICLVTRASPVHVVSILKIKVNITIKININIHTKLFPVMILFFCVSFRFISHLMTKIPWYIFYLLFLICKSLADKNLFKYIAKRVKNKKKYDYICMEVSFFFLTNAR